jgi:hypothetical protein
VEQLRRYSQGVFAALDISCWHPATRFMRPLAEPRSRLVLCERVQTKQLRHCRFHLHVVRSEFHSALPPVVTQ